MYVKILSNQANLGPTGLFLLVKEVSVGIVHILCASFFAKCNTEHWFTENTNNQIGGGRFLFLSLLKEQKQFLWS